MDMYLMIDSQHIAHLVVSFVIFSADTGVALCPNVLLAAPCDICGPRSVKGSDRAVIYGPAALKEKKKTQGF